jgi:L-ascorbate metabolism protein UlaG (beta-lactamase superfamily)
MTSRRRLLRMLGAVGVLGAGGWGVLSASRGNAYYQGPPSDHFDGVQFFNPGQPGPRGRLAFLRWQLTDRGTAWPAAFPSPFAADRPPPLVDGEAVRIAYVGHATFLLQARGRSILIDPVWAERASPFSLVGPKRVNPPAIAFEHLPRIDTVLVTHNHYDHMDVATLSRLWHRHRPRIITPLGNDTIMRSAVSGLAAEAVDWHMAVDLGGGMAVHIEPTQHWSARGTSDRSHALWASFVVELGAGRKIYCVGDSGFGDGRTFRRVAERHPGLLLALLPIGAYEPRWFMRNSHMNPDEAVRALALSGARQAFGHHWGTFRLTNEAVEQPAIDLAAALARHGVGPQQFRALRPGEVHWIA